MGILSTLLTGGSLLGKVCQTLAESGFARGVMDNGEPCLYRASTMEVNGVRFTEVRTNGNTSLNAYNTDPSMYACVTYPNGFGQQGGGQIFVPPQETVTLPGKDLANAPAELPFSVQKMDLASNAGDDESRVIISFKDLKLDGAPLVVDAARLFATSRALKVTFTRGGLGDLLACDLYTDTGVHCVLQQPVKREPVESDPSTGLYEIPFPSLGVSGNDLLNGTLQFAIPTNTRKELMQFARQSAKNSALRPVSNLLSSGQ